MTEGATFRLGYRPSLDGLRALAIALVVLHHDRRLPGGFLGVDLFFVLSGFLITSILREEWEAKGDVRLARFYGRRLLRLGPALVVFVLSCWMATNVVQPELAGLLPSRWALAALFYVTNLVIAYGRHYPLGLVSIHWSLAIEEQFYLLWPVAFRRLLRWKLSTDRMAALLLGASLLPLLARVVLLSRGGADPTLWMRLYFAPDTRADALLIGCALGLLMARRPPGRHRVLGALSALLGTAVLLPCWWSLDIGDVARQPFLPPLTALGSAALLFGTLQGGLWVRVLEWAPVVWLGRLSYSLYLWHVVALDLSRGLGVAGKLGVMLALAAASHYLVERPFLDLKSRLSRESIAVEAASSPRPPLGRAWMRLVAGAAVLLVLTGAGYTRRVRGRGADEVAEARDRLAGHADDPDRLRELGEALQRTGGLSEAVEVLTRAATVRPEDAPVQTALGNALRQSGRGLEAAARFQRALAVDPQLAAAHLGLAELALDLNQLPAAVASFERCLALDPASADAHNGLGVASALGGNLERAVAEFEEAARLRPDSATLANLARARADLARRQGRAP